MSLSVKQKPEEVPKGKLHLNGSVYPSEIGGSESLKDENPFVLSVVVSGTRLQENETAEDHLTRWVEHWEKGASIPVYVYDRAQSRAVMAKLVIDGKAKATKGPQTTTMTLYSVIHIDEDGMVGFLMSFSDAAAAKGRFRLQLDAAGYDTYETDDDVPIPAKVPEDEYYGWHLVTGRAEVVTLSADTAGSIDAGCFPSPSSFPTEVSHT